MLALAWFAFFFSGVNIKRASLGLLMLLRVPASWLRSRLGVILLPC